MATKFKPAIHFVVGLKLLAAIAGTELMIMLLAGRFNVERWLTPIQFDFVDTSILSITASFLIFHWVIKPLKAASKTIGEYKQLEGILRTSEYQYRNLFENNSQPMWIYDRETLSILAVNEAAVDHYGYSREEFLAMTVKDLYRPEDHPAVVAAIAQITGEIRRPGVWKQKKKDGTLIDVNVVTHNLVFNGRQARHVLINDVTEQQKSKEDLQNALRKVADEKARSEAIIEAIGDGITIQDKDFKITYQNAISTSLMGNHVGEFCYMAYDGIGHTREECPVATSFKDGKVHTVVRSVRTDKGIMYFESTASALRDADGKIIAGIEVMRDITKRKKTDEALKESEGRYRTLAEAAQDVIFVINREDRVEYVNTFGASLFGLRPGEMIGRQRKTLFPDISDEQGEKLGDVYKTGVPLYFEERASFPEGDTWLGTLIVPLRNEAGEVTAVMGISRNINERKRSEEKIRQQVQQLSALRSVDIAISSSLDIRLTLDIFLEHVLDQLHVDAASVLLLKPHTKMLEFAAHRGFRTQALKHTQLRMGQGNAGLAVLKQSIVHIPDVKSDEAFSRAPLLADEQFVSYYGVPLIAKGVVKGVLEIFHRSPLHPDQGWQDFLESLALQAAIAIDNAALFENLEKSNLELAMAYDLTIEGWSRALDYRDQETEGHSQRVTELTVKICQAMGMSDRDLTYVRWGALLHDIGKLGVPDNILFKPGKLDDDEWKIMKRHPVLAYELLQPICYLRAAVDIPYCHHEKWDGTGYPRGLKKEQIPLAARIFSIVDVWDALGSDRPYRPAWPKEKIFQYLNDQTGKDFDPKVTEIFVKLLGEGAISDMHSDNKNL
jgi:PAS domain S-box-containing protein/putative nucleotidyltransferase with HDIG domain